MGALSTFIIGGAAVAGGIAGAAKAKKGTPDQTGTSTRTLFDKSEQQLGLEGDSMRSYRDQQALAGQLEQGIGQADALRDPAIQAYLQQISGQAFQATPEELAGIQNIRNAMIQQGAADVNQFVDKGLTQATSGAAARGIRGQALGSLRGDVIQEGTRQIGGITNQANLYAANQAASLPFQRVQAQQQALNAGLTYGDQLRQQAMQNRQALQSPFLLQQMQQERLATGTETKFKPGQKGSWGDAAIGFLGGAAGGATSATDVMGGIGNLGGMGGGGGGGGMGTSYGTGLGGGGGQYSFDMWGGK